MFLCSYGVQTLEVTGVDGSREMGYYIISIRGKYGGYKLVTKI